jgi:hypothetical protein
MHLPEHPEGSYLAPIAIIHPCGDKTMIVPPCYGSLRSEPVHALGQRSISGDQDLKPSHSEAYCPLTRTTLGNPSQPTLLADSG